MKSEACQVRRFILKLAPGLAVQALRGGLRPPACLRVKLKIEGTHEITADVFLKSPDRLPGSLTNGVCALAKNVSRASRRVPAAAACADKTFKKKKKKVIKICAPGDCDDPRGDGQPKNTTRRNERRHCCPCRHKTEAASVT